MSRGTFFKMVVATALVSSVARGAVSLDYASTMPQDQSDRLNSDLAALPAMNFVDSSGEMIRIMHLPDSSSQSLESWLADRAHFVVDESFKFDNQSVVPVAPIAMAKTVRQGFDALDGFKRVLHFANAGPVQQQQQPTPKAQIVMSNVGSALYANGKEHGFIIGVKLNGNQGVILRTPRAGLFQVGAGLFKTLSPRLPPAALASFVHIVFRLETLFHESRHDDGNNQTLGFSHILCPTGHDLAGLPACDAPSNGAYRIGALVQKSLIEGCGTNGCQPGEKEVLTMMYADNISRIMSPIPQGKLAVASDLCSKLNQVNPANTICNAQPVAAQTVEWDDSPEALKE